MMSSYPIVPQPEADPRFTLVLVLDVAKVLEKHGYPAFTSGNVEDIIELQQALYQFIYRERIGS